MIFVTVGAQMAFDRLVDAVDQWAARHPEVEVHAQIGPSALEPDHLHWTRFIEPDAFVERVRQSRLVVAHAGMGSIITALRYGVPILVMPRRGELRETRNDHQVATAERFREMQRVAVAMDENELRLRLDAFDEIATPARIGDFASPELLATIETFVSNDRLPASHGRRLPWPFRRRPVRPTIDAVERGLQEEPS